ncbi:uncharacterized protein LOC129580396 [Sitodiplosis mosellana]|uniref:uncharacterized protein LOC129580396 n=1 Tax=Sitodiplosis mosellana TaxID=263140 RepID=UPI0024445AE9|nr:uncharacterized protein LOC129580396 [Sitodiplosis mosellana]
MADPIKGLAAFILLNFVHLTVAQQLCTKIDFDRTVLPEFRECTDQRLPALYITDYASHREVPPYRPASPYYLSNSYFGLSCIESVIVLAFDKYTSIEAAIYLKSLGSAFVEINVYDATHINSLVKSFRSDGTQNWSILRGSVDRNISNARVEIKAYTDLQTVLAIQFLHILNSAIDWSECKSTTQPLTTRPPPITSPLPPVTSTGPPAKNPEQTWWWVIFGACALVVVLIIIIVCVICMLNMRRTRSHDCTAK